MGRVVLFSDTHGFHHRITLPEADIAIFAGDFSGRGTLADAKRFLDWYSNQSQCTHKLAIAGNHDLCLDPERQDPYSKEWISQTLEEYPGVRFLENESITIDGIKIWGSPITPDFYPEYWAFNKPRGKEIAEVWSKIPDDAGIVVTHGPVHGILDRTFTGVNAGCKDLRDRLEQVQPKLHVCGHIHEAYGVQKIGSTTYVNASVCDLEYYPINLPVVFELFG